MCFVLYFPNSAKPPPPAEVDGARGVWPVAESGPPPSREPERNVAASPPHRVEGPIRPAAGPGEWNSLPVLVERLRSALELSCSSGSSEEQVHPEDSGIDSEGDLRPRLPMDRQSPKPLDQQFLEDLLLSDIQTALARLRETLRRADVGALVRYSSTLDPASKLHLLRLVSNLLAKLKIPESPEEESQPRPSPPRRRRRERHTVVVTAEELARARKWLEEERNLAERPFPESARLDEAQVAPAKATRQDHPERTAERQFDRVREKHVKDAINHRQSLQSRSKEPDGSPEDDTKAPRLVDGPGVEEEFGSFAAPFRPPEPPVLPVLPVRCNKFSAKKSKIKRANTIDIPSYLKLQAEGHGRNQGCIALRRPIGVGDKVLAGTTKAVPSFEPKTENDRKFLALIGRNSESGPAANVLPFKNFNYRQPSVADRNWNDRFADIKTTFDKPRDVSPEDRGPLKRPRDNSGRLRAGSNEDRENQGVVVGSLKLPYATAEPTSGFTHAPTSPFRKIEKTGKDFVPEFLKPKLLEATAETGGTLQAKVKMFDKESNRNAPPPQTKGKYVKSGNAPSSIPGTNGAMENGRLNYQSFCKQFAPASNGRQTESSKAPSRIGSRESPSKSNRPGVVHQRAEYYDDLEHSEGPRPRYENPDQWSSRNPKPCKKLDNDSGGLHRRGEYYEDQDRQEDPRRYRYENVDRLDGSPKSSLSRSKLDETPEKMIDNESRTGWDGKCFDAAPRNADVGNDWSTKTIQPVAPDNGPHPLDGTAKDHPVTEKTLPEFQGLFQPNVDGSLDLGTSPDVEGVTPKSNFPKVIPLQSLDVDTNRMSNLPQSGSAPSHSPAESHIGKGYEVSDKSPRYEPLMASSPVKSNPGYPVDNPRVYQEQTSYPEVGHRVSVHPVPRDFEVNYSRPNESYRSYSSSQNPIKTIDNFLRASLSQGHLPKDADDGPKSSYPLTSEDNDRSYPGSRDEERIRSYVPWGHSSRDLSNREKQRTDYEANYPGGAEEASRQDVFQDRNYEDRLSVSGVPRTEETYPRIVPNEVVLPEEDKIANQDISPEGVVTRYTCAIATIAPEASMLPEERRDSTESLSGKNRLGPEEKRDVPDETAQQMGEVPRAEPRKREIPLDEIQRHNLLQQNLARKLQSDATSKPPKHLVFDSSLGREGVPFVQEASSRGFTPPRQPCEPVVESNNTQEKIGIFESRNPNRHRPSPVRSGFRGGPPKVNVVSPSKIVQSKGPIGSSAKLIDSSDEYLMSCASRPSRSIVLSKSESWHQLALSKSNLQVPRVVQESPPRPPKSRSPSSFRLSKQFEAAATSDNVKRMEEKIQRYFHSPTNAGSGESPPSGRRESKSKRCPGPAKRSQNGLARSHTVPHLYDERNLVELGDVDAAFDDLFRETVRSDARC
ncbi:uncharacterized protein LOC105695569 isoform X2 [Orussus abietinus]|uniref:uncharacterized protein LOC105695569 isoform X2 n=1 Tax=Orussus abietinus TaxID=222816 RepID=UPI000625571E|nr:uncharacterized protein LOC105695569 isoform X2 [Orussus abietinus]